MCTRSLFLLLSLLLAGLALFPGPAGAGTVAAGASHTVVVMPDGTVWVWGANGSGQLGDGTTTTRAVPTQLTTLSDIVAVAAGSSHTLALKSDGTVYAWGNNTHGQLGNGSTTPSTSPVTANVTGIVAITAGAYHSVALASDGRVWVWGQNSSGQVGKGSTSTSESTPYMVTTLTSVAAIGAGGQHTLAVKSDGTVYGFGENGNGQLGVGNTTDQTSPAQMSGVTGASAAAGGASHSLILKSDGTMRATGYNVYGQLGNGNTTPQTTSVAVSSLTSVALIAAGDYHSVAVNADGTVVAWGLNDNGRLGDGTTTSRSTPTAITSLSGIDKVAAGGSHTLAVTTTGVVSTWGNNASSQLGDGTTTGRSSPAAISGPNYAWKVGTPLFSVNAGTYNTDKTVVITCATPGAAIHYTLDGAEPTESDPSLSSGGSVAIDQTRTLKARAWNGAMPPSEIRSAVYTMQVGSIALSPGPSTYTIPQTVSASTTTPNASIRYTLDGSTPTEASPLYTAPLAVSTTTAIYVKGFRTGWTPSGLNGGTYTMNFGTLAAPGVSPAAGTYTSSVSVTLSAMPGATIRYTTNGSTPGTSSPIYSAPLDLTATTTVKARAYHPDYTTSAVTTATYTIDVAAPAFSPTGGTYTAGQLIVVSTATPGATIHYTTNGTEPTEADPVIASGDSLPVGNFTLKAKAWKTSLTTSATTTATYAVTGTVTTAMLAGGEMHALAVRADGAVFGWGNNDGGRVGDGTTTRRPNPVRLNGLSGTTAVDAGYDHSLALRSDGRVFAWGRNYKGQLGDGTTTTRTVPQLVPGLTTAVAISAGQEHSLALLADGTVRAWGHNSQGELGDGTTTQRPSPVTVSGLSNVVGISAGRDFSLAVTQSGSVYAWGDNISGQLGDGTTTDRLVPTLVGGLSNVTAVAAGGFFSVALKADGTVVEWGSHGYLWPQHTSPVAVSGLTDATRIIAGYGHALALKSDGTVVGWGTNESGQLGNGTETSYLSPVPVATLTTVVAIAAGDYHSFALRSGDEAWAWGSANQSRLGNSQTAEQGLDAVTSPEPISGLDLHWKVWTPLLSLPSGQYFTAQTVTVTCPDPPPVGAPTLHYTVTGPDPTESDPTVACGGSVAVPESLTLKVRGWRPDAPISDVTAAAYELKAVAPAIAPGTGGYATPQSVTVSTTTAGATLTYTLDGAEPASGSTLYAGPLTIGSTLTLKARAYKTGWTPSDSTPASYWISEGTAAAPTITPTAGAYTEPPFVMIATTTAGAMLRYTVDGSEPTGASGIYRYPFSVGATTTIKAKAFKAGLVPSATTTAAYQVDVAGATATPSISPSGGRFTTRQTITITGPSGATLRYTTTGVDPTTGDTTIASGGTVTIDRSLVLKVRAWQTGLEASAVRRADFIVTGAIAAGPLHTVALKSDRTVWGFGSKFDGKLALAGTPYEQYTPVQILTDAVAVAAGHDHTLAVMSDGRVMGFGRNTDGQLGDGTPYGGSTPRYVTGLTNVVAVAAGEKHSLALTADGRVFAWGDNDFGQLGDGTTTPRFTPVQVVGISGASYVAAGSDFSLAITNDGAEGGLLWAWGHNDDGQLGDGSLLDRGLPVRVAGLASVHAVSASIDWGLAAAAGRALGWGRNTRGEVGDGTTTSSSTPVPTLVVRDPMLVGGHRSRRGNRSAGPSVDVGRQRLRTACGRPRVSAPEWCGTADR